MTIKEARKMLGSKYDSVPDEDIEKIMTDLKGLAHICIDHFYETILPNIKEKTLEILANNGYSSKKLKEFMDYKDFRIGAEKINFKKYEKFLEDYMKANEQASDLESGEFREDSSKTQN